MTLPAIETYVFDAPSHLKIVAKRYTTTLSTHDVGGLTLVFTHCIGSHKEQWEPVIQHLFRSQYTKDKRYRIREAWSFDWQNHGDAAVLNREALKLRPKGVSAYEWSEAIAEFIRSPRMKGHRIVGLGHSAGAATVLLTTKGIPSNELPFVAMILIEPTIVTREVFNEEREDRMSAMDFAVTATSTRRDNWRSREQALAYFKKRLPWGLWDPRALQILVDHGLETLPSGEVALKCDRKQEAISYPDVEPHFEGALHLGRVCHTLPIHLIWGARNDFVPDFIRDSLSDAKEGRIVASVTKVKDAGHLVVQEQPTLLAEAIVPILDGIGPVPRSRL
ncbi:hypothetical protein M413DRAFT_448020 [Hebeloma cylindrosporum]|uniref:AB hydrolase-1 domain-containing protein n=1 Tax=Hebeloma cylindrosporum TaxID=76867 RepID=A0A0C3C1Y1_HEBCY|nr:hypothetical protein M413DRAFT_448020 [Hebeloma cylindrosporum h7]